jgi:hypothetical protein
MITHILLDTFKLQASSDHFVSIIHMLALGASLKLTCFQGSIAVDMINFVATSGEKTMHMLVVSIFTVTEVWITWPLGIHTLPKTTSNAHSG